MSIQEALVLNVVGILALGFLLGMLVPFALDEKMRGISVAWWVWTLLCLSGLGWIIFVVVHFLGKYW